MVHSTLTCKQQLFKLPQTDGVPDICSVPGEVGTCPQQTAQGQMAENTHLGMKMFNILPQD